MILDKYPRAVEEATVPLRAIQLQAKSNVQLEFYALLS